MERRVLKTDSSGNPTLLDFIDSEAETQERAEMRLEQEERGEAVRAAFRAGYRQARTKRSPASL